MRNTNPVKRGLVVQQAPGQLVKGRVKKEAPPPTPHAVVRFKYKSPQRVINSQARVKAEQRMAPLVPQAIGVIMQPRRHYPQVTVNPAPPPVVVEPPPPPPPPAPEPQPSVTFGTQLAEPVIGTIVPIGRTE